MSMSWDEVDDRETCITCQGGTDGLCGDCEDRGFEIYMCGCVTCPDGANYRWCEKHSREEEELEAFLNYGKQEL